MCHAAGIDDGLSALLADLKQEEAAGTEVRLAARGSARPAPQSAPAPNMPSLTPAAPAALQGPLVLHGFTPMSKLASLGVGGDLLNRQASASAAPAIAPAPAAAAAAPTLFSPAGTHTLLKGGGLDATPLVMPITFVPVPASSQSADGLGMLACGGKLRPGAAPGAPGAPLPLQPSGGSFTIPAYARPLTQLDFISPGEA